MPENFQLGLIGHPVKHSLSPLLHEAALSYLGLKGGYRLFDIDPIDLESSLFELGKQGLRGVNVTIPHKQAVMPFLTELTDEAKYVGAVNTIVFDDDGKRLTGHNTDVYGFSKSLTEALEREHVDKLWSKAVLVIGCGGAARAVVAGLCDLGYYDIAVYGRDSQKAHTFVSSLAKSFGSKGDLLLQSNLLRVIENLEDENEIRSKLLLVNATPMGQDAKPLPDWFSACVSNLDRRAFIYDLVYSKMDMATPLEELAQSKGYASIDGLDMLIYQAARAFEIWTSRAVPVECMRGALEQLGRC